MVELPVTVRRVVVLLEELRERQKKRKFLTEVVDKVPDPCVLWPLALLIIISIMSHRNGAHTSA